MYYHFISFMYLHKPAVWKQKLAEESKQVIVLILVAGDPNSKPSSVSSISWACHSVSLALHPSPFFTHRRRQLAQLIKKFPFWSQHLSIKKPKRGRDKKGGRKEAERKGWGAVVVVQLNIGKHVWWWGRVGTSLGSRGTAQLQHPPLVHTWPKWWSQEWRPDLLIPGPGPFVLNHVASVVR